MSDDRRNNLNHKLLKEIQEPVSTNIVNSMTLQCSHDSIQDFKRPKSSGHRAMVADISEQSSTAFA